MLLFSLVIYPIIWSAVIISSIFCMCFRSVKDLARLSLTEPVFVSVHEHSIQSTPVQLQQVSLFAYPGINYAQAKIIRQDQHNLRHAFLTEVPPLKGRNILVLVWILSGLASL